MPKVQMLRVVNPRRPKSRAAAKSFSKRRTAVKRRARRNPLAGGGELLLMTNPKRKQRRSNSSSRRRRSNPFGFKTKRRSSHRRRSNPIVARSSRRRRRNPAIAGATVTDLLKIGGSAAVGGVATRSLTQMVLQANNTGWTGYAANFAAALGLAYLGGKFVGDKVGLGLAAGGISATVMRIWQEKVSLTSPNTLSGMGDMDFSGDGLGEYVNTPFSMPSVSKLIGGNYIVQQPPWPQAAPPAAVPQKAAASLGAPRRVERWLPR
jgi:hypothetical protein